MLDKRWFVGLVIVFFSAGLTLAACGDDGTGGQNANNNGADAGDAGEDGDDDPQDGGNEDGGGDDECTEGEGDCASGEVCEDGECVVEEIGCDTDDPPERCEQSFDDTDWGPMSLVDELAIADTDEECCFDFDGDDQNENAVAELLGLAGEGAGEVNDTIAENIDEGELNLILEHDGLEDPAEDDEYATNFYLGVYEDDALMIDPTSLDGYDEEEETGTYPVARMPEAELSDGQLTAGPGTINLSLELFEGTPLDLSIQQAELEAEVDEDNSSAEDGVALTDGKLGGVVGVIDVYDEINTFAENCDCLEIEDDEDLITYDEDDLSQATTECNLPDDGNTCSEEDDAEAPCYTLGDFCSELTFLPQVADIDTDDDGDEDALSIGATFGAEGTTVEGIGEASLQE